MQSPRLVATGIEELAPAIRSGDEGRHVSTIIRWMCIRLGHFTSESSDREQQTRFEMGFAFEDAVVAALIDRYARGNPHRYLRVGELERDGLIGTPDLADFDTESIIEMKLTWMSARHDPESTKFWRYWTQAKAYCALIGWRKVRLHVGHVMGDYRGSGPLYNVWEWEFSKADIEQNWRTIVSNGEVMREHGGKDGYV